MSFRHHRNQRHTLPANKAVRRAGAPTGLSGQKDALKARIPDHGRTRLGEAGKGEERSDSKERNDGRDEEEELTAATALASAVAVTALVLRLGISPLLVLERASVVVEDKGSGVHGGRRHGESESGVHGPPLIQPLRSHA